MLLVIYIGTIMYAFLSGYFVPLLTGISYSKKRFFWIWCTLLLLLMSVTTATYNYADVETYQTQFNLANIYKVPVNELNDIGLGLYLLFRISYMLSLNYRGMMLIAIILCMFLLHKSMDFIPLNENIFWGFFLIFPGIIEIIQIKYFLGSSIVIYSFKYLVQDKKYSILKFIIGIFIAYLFHSACIVFLLLLIVKFIKNKKCSVSLKITLIGTFVMFLLLRFIPGIADKFFASVRIERYLGNLATQASMYNFFQVISSWLIMVIISIYCYLKLSQNNSIIEKNQLLNVVFKNYTALCVLGITLPLLTYDLNFFRFIEISFIFGYIVISIYFNEIISVKNIIIIGVLIIVLYLTYHFYSGGNGTPLFQYDGWVNIFQIGE
ncbi:EpsG family protein [uncultured Lactobacillus sp.]|jgi:hypothetical protein|uniref:EpsG family protein n=1 Tax=uncultured Lactobacillus sp. TaxID=153152 RepID=UPI00258DE446|nr:EpsG family protein [uncultured Lactobacillus sp.]